MRDTMATELAGRWNPDANTPSTRGRNEYSIQHGGDDGLGADAPRRNRPVLQLYDAADREKVLYRPVFTRTCKKETKSLSFLEPGRPKYSSHSCLNMSLHSQL